MKVRGVGGQGAEDGEGAAELPGGIQYAAGRARALGRNLVAEQGGHRGQGQGVVFLLSLYLQQSRGLPVLATGLAFVPMTVLTGFSTARSSRTAPCGGGTGGTGEQQHGVGWSPGARERRRASFSW